jgi:aldose 1-epimerase
LELEPSGLSVDLEIANTGAEDMPAGMGLHPYFPRSGTTRLGFRAKGVWLAGPDQLPREQIAVPPPLDFSAGRDLGTEPIDNDFTGWTPPAVVDQPDFGYRMRIEADPLFGHLIVFAPPEQPFFAAEPVSHMIDALNRPPVEGGGMAVLAPGERLAGRVRFAVESL